MLLFFVINNEVIKIDFEKIKDFFLGKKGLVIGIIATILIGGYFIQKNNQPVVNNNQVLSENNKNQSTDFSKNKSNNTQIGRASCRERV